MRFCVNSEQAVKLGEWDGLFAFLLLLVIDEAGATGNYWSGPSKDISMLFPICSIKTWSCSLRIWLPAVSFARSRCVQ